MESKLSRYLGFPLAKSGHLLILPDSSVHEAYVLHLSSVRREGFMPEVELAYSEGGGRNECVKHTDLQFITYFKGPL